LAIEEIRYLTYAEAVVHHIVLMRLLGETRFGIFDRALLESALGRPKHAATFDNADLPSQAASLCYGLIKNRPWVGRQQEDGNTPHRSLSANKRKRHFFCNERSRGNGSRH
jgi:hypothetical protein